MNWSKCLVWALACGMILLTVGCECSQSVNDLKAQNRIQQQRIADLESELGICNADLLQKTQTLEGLTGKSGVDLKPKMP